jgi:BlaI family transcriptional regulator, penicillinase repressor
MPLPAKISPAEWEVLNIVWDRAPVSAPDVAAALADETAWHAKTVLTFLTRLVDKGVVKVRRDGKLNLYTAKLTRAQCVREESETFLQRVFRGATAPLLAHFVEHAELTDDEITELQRLLKQRKPSSK